MPSQDTIILRQGTVSGPTGWGQVNPILNSGEIGYETDTNRFKIGSSGALGTGVMWNDLDYFKTYVTAGVINNDPICSVSGLNLTLSSCQVVIYDDSTFSGTPLQYNVTGTTLTLTDNTVNYIAVNYNNGTPIYQNTLNVDDINESNVIPINTILTVNGYVHLSHWDRIADGLPNKLHRRFVKTQRYARESGLSLTTGPIGPSGYNDVIISTGIVWRGARPFNLNQTNASGTNGSVWFFYHTTGGAWTQESFATNYNFTQYDNRTNLVSMSNNNRYNINWIYRGVEDHEHGYYVLSDKEYATLPDAIAETRLPTIPTNISTHSILVGRIMCRMNVTAPVWIEGAFDASFSGTVLNDHNQLGGLQGGMVNGISGTSEFYHLTSTGPTGLDYALAHANTTGSNPHQTTALQVGAPSLHGFVNRTDSTMLFSSASGVDNPVDPVRTFVIKPYTSSYDVYINGVKSTINSRKTIQIPATTGQNFVWMTSTGSLQTSLTPWSLTDLSIIPVATVYWDGVSGHLGEERHGYGRNLVWHNYQHTNVGTMYTSGYTPTPTFNSPSTSNTFSFIGGVISDEDIQNNTTINDASISGTNHVQCCIGYRTAPSGTLTFDPKGLTYAKLTNTFPSWDNNGSITGISSNNYGLVWVYATNRVTGTSPIVSIMGQGEYTSVALAQSAPQPTLTGLSVAEWKLLYRVILRRTNTVAAGFIQADVMYNIANGPAISAASPSTVAAANVTFSPYSDISGTNTQTAVQQVADLRAPVASPKFTGTVTVNSETVVTGTATTNINWGASGNKQKLLLNANITTMTFTSPSGPTNLTLKVVQGGSGVTGYAITWPSTGTTTGVKWSGGTPPTITPATGSLDIVTFYFDGTGYYGMAGNDFK